MVAAERVRAARRAVPASARSFALVVAVATAGLAAGTLACGPSFQVIYEGNSRFEHCYALEENSQASMPAKAACWRDWSERYTYGQTRDRINYATARYVALAAAPNNPTDEALMNAAPGENPRATTITAPAPTNAFAPPPKVLEAVPPMATKATTTLTASNGAPAASIPMLDAGAGPEPPRAPQLPASSCADTCGGTYQKCNATCDADAGAKAKASCQACTTTYRGCMRGCFR